MEYFNIKCRPYYIGAMANTTRVFVTDTYFFADGAPGQTLAKAVWDGKVSINLDIKFSNSTFN